jgi:hypothetical protein
MVDVQTSSFYQIPTPFLVFIYRHFGTAEMAFIRIEWITSMATWIFLVRRGVLASHGGVVEDCPGVTDTGNVQLIAGRLTPALDFCDDPAVLYARVLDRYDQILVPVDLSAAGVISYHSECAFISLFEFAQDLLERQEVRRGFLGPLRRSHVQFT